MQTMYCKYVGIPDLVPGEGWYKALAIIQSQQGY